MRTNARALKTAMTRTRRRRMIERIVKAVQARRRMIERIVKAVQARRMILTR